MADLNLDINYFEHIKTKRLVAALGPGADVYPLRLWCYAAKHYPRTGRLVGHSAEEIDNLIGFTVAGQQLFAGRMPGECTRTMHKIGFLDLDGETFVIHGWKERAGHIVAFSKRASIAAKARWGKLRHDAKGNACSIPKDENEHSPIHPSSPSNPTGPTHPSNQPRARGSGGGSAAPAGDGGNGIEEAGAKLLKAANVQPDMNSRAGKVRAMLAKVGVRAKVQNELCDREDLTPEYVRDTINRLARGGRAESLPAVLVTELREHKP